MTRITYSGVVNYDDLARLLQDTQKIESLSVVPHRLCNFCAVEMFDLNFTDVMDFVKQRAATKFANSFKSAIVAKDNVQYGFARMYQTLNQNPQITVKVFRDETSALAWIQNGKD